MECEICNSTYRPGFIEFESSSMQKRFLCEGHSVDFYVWISDMQEEEKKEYLFEENDKTPKIILPLAGFLIALNIINRLFFADELYTKILLFSLSVVYIAAFCSPSIYPRVLRIGSLRPISLRSYRKIKRQDIIGTAATVIVGSLIFLTLFSGGFGG